MKVKSESEVARSCPTLSDPHGLQPTRLLHPWEFPGRSTGVGCRRLLLIPNLSLSNSTSRYILGEGNGNPLQCSCLENPRDGGAWWATVYGVVQSRTRLTQLSSSSSRYILKKNECSWSPNDIHKHSNFTHQSQKLETMKYLSIREWIHCSMFIWWTTRQQWKRMKS